MRLIVAVLLSCIITVSAIAENWPRFRGTNGSGIAANSNIPAQWSLDDIAWTVDLPGTGDSSPVVWDGTVYITSANEGSNIFTIIALRATDGKKLWHREYPYEPLRIHTLNSHATSTPAVDASGLYVLLFTGTNSVVFALDHAGNEIWTRDLGPSATLHGPALSPILYKDALVFSFEQEVNNLNLKSRWYALDTRSGETLWQVERDSDIKASSSTPCIYQRSDGTEWLIFSSNEHGITAIDPENGNVIWEEKSAMPTRVVGSPIVSNDLIVANCGAGGSISTLVAIRPSADATPGAEILYSIQEKYVPYLSTPIVVGDLMFTFGDRGTITCSEVASGTVLWSERLRGRIFGSPVLIEDRLYCINAKGGVIVIKASDKFVLLAINDLGEVSKASPAVADGRLFLRTSSRLNCVAAPNI